MELVRSNRTEALADALADAIRTSKLDPFESEAVVVQSRGMERWLTLALADRLGVWSNPSFPFPRSAIESVLRELDEEASVTSDAYEPRSLHWTIALLLAEESPPELAGYLGASSKDSDRVLRLAALLSRTFDQYVVYRPDLLRDWSGGRGGSWQSELWRRIAERLGPHDLASRIERAVPLLRRGHRVSSFRRLHLFSLETLPPLFMQFFEALSHQVPVHMYLQAPTTEYLADVDGARQLSLGVDPPKEGHPLLTSLGRLTGDFQQILLDTDSNVQREHERFVEPSRATLLGALQSDALAFRKHPDRDARTKIGSEDRSIAVHACTSPMREVMVLHDIVREALEEDSTLQPEDIVVMAPDLDAYAPAFRAVFGKTGSGAIPYEIHDRRASDDSALLDDFIAVLEVLESRFSVLDMVRLLDGTSWRTEFRFSSPERARLTELLEASGIRWGIDAEHREAFGMPPEGLHTWRIGLQRLFLGYASMPGETTPFGRLLPRGDASLDDAQLIARLARFCETLFSFRDRMRHGTSLRQWADSLDRLSQSLFDEQDDATGAVRNLHGALDRLRSGAVSSGYDLPISLNAVRRELASDVAGSAVASGFLRRGVTLSELVPLRSVPFRMVCLIGMSEESFPRADDRLSFDLTRAEHRLGDRNKRLDDRHSFLQAILCARDRLAVTYSPPVPTARSEPNPSSTVWELMHTLDLYYVRDDGSKVVEPTVHPMHGFDRRYFEPGGPLWSFSESHLEVAETIAARCTRAQRFELVADDPVEKTVVSIGEIAEWLWYPARAFVERRLGVRLGTATLYEPARALIKLEPLDSFRVGNDALSAQLGDGALDEFLRAAPEFPDGGWGALERERLATEIGSVLDYRRGLAGPSTERRRWVKVDVAGLSIAGHLGGLQSESRIKERFNRVATKTELTTWLEHLLMQAADDRSLPDRTELVLRGAARADRVSFEPVPDASAQLERLAALYLASHRTPVALLPRASWQFEMQRGAGKPRDKALDSAISKHGKQGWDGYGPFVWGAAGPFSDRGWCEAFMETSERVYSPLFAHRRVR